MVFYVIRYVDFLFSLFYEKYLKLEIFTPNIRVAKDLYLKGSFCQYLIPLTVWFSKFTSERVSKSITVHAPLKGAENIQKLYLHIKTT